MTQNTHTPIQLSGETGVGIANMTFLYYLNYYFGSINIYDYPFQ